jgi:hypothetical protein
MRLVNEIKAIRQKPAMSGAVLDDGDEKLCPSCDEFRDWSSGSKIGQKKNKGPPMSKAPSYAERAEQCEQMALRLKDPEARRRFVELAQKWRALAKQAEDKNQDEA